MASTQMGGGARRRFDPVRLLLRAGLTGALVLAGLLTFACIDANWRFARLEAAAPARVFSAPFVLADGVAVARDDLQERLPRALIEPEALGTLSGNVLEERLAVSIEDLPEHLLDAVIAVEDRRFYRHS